MNEKLIDKIRKLLRLSDSPNENEAKLAMEKALEIAQQHGIELSKITTEVKTNSISDESIQMGQRLPIVGNYVFCILNKFFNVKVLTSGSRAMGKSVILVGTPENISIAKHIYTFLSGVMEDSWKTYYNSRNIPLSERKNYYLGFFTELSRKLEENKKKVESVNTNLGLMVINNSKAIEDYTNNKWNNLKKGKGLAGNYSDSFYDGVEKGKETNLHAGFIS